MLNKYFYKNLKKKESYNFTNMALQELSQTLGIVAISLLFISITIMMFSLRRFLKGEFREFLQWVNAVILFMSGAYFFSIYLQVFNIRSGDNYELIQFVVNTFMIISSLFLIKMSLVLDNISRVYGLARFRELLEGKFAKKSSKKK